MIDRQERPITIDPNSALQGITQVEFQENKQNQQQIAEKELSISSLKSIDKDVSENDHSELASSQVNFKEVVDLGVSNVFKAQINSREMQFLDQMNEDVSDIEISAKKIQSGPAIDDLLESQIRSSEVNSSKSSYHSAQLSEQQIFSDQSQQEEAYFSPISIQLDEVNSNENKLEKQVEILTQANEYDQLKDDMNTLEEKVDPTINEQENNHIYQENKPDQFREQTLHDVIDNADFPEKLIKEEIQELEHIDTIQSEEDIEILYPQDQSQPSVIEDNKRTAQIQEIVTTHKDNDDEQILSATDLSPRDQAENPISKSTYKHELNQTINRGDDKEIINQIESQQLSRLEDETPIIQISSEIQELDFNETLNETSDKQVSSKYSQQINKIEQQQQLLEQIQGVSNDSLMGSECDMEYLLYIQENNNNSQNDSKDIEEDIDQRSIDLATFLQYKSDNDIRELKEHSPVKKSLQVLTQSVVQQQFQDQQQITPKDQITGLPDDEVLSQVFNSVDPRKQENQFTFNDVDNSQIQQSESQNISFNLHGSGSPTDLNDNMLLQYSQSTQNNLSLNPRFQESQFSNAEQSEVNLLDSRVSEFQSQNASSLTFSMKQDSLITPPKMNLIQEEDSKLETSQLKDDSPNKPISCNEQVEESKSINLLVDDLNENLIRKLKDQIKQQNASYRMSLFEKNLKIETIEHETNLKFLQEIDQLRNKLQQQYTEQQLIINQNLSLQVEKKDFHEKIKQQSQQIAYLEKENLQLKADKENPEQKYHQTEVELRNLELISNKSDVGSESQLDIEERFNLLQNQFDGPKTSDKLKDELLDQTNKLQDLLLPNDDSKSPTEIIEIKILEEQLDSYQSKNQQQNELEQLQEQQLQEITYLRQYIQDRDNTIKTLLNDTQNLQYVIQNHETFKQSSQVTLDDQVKQHQSNLQALQDRISALQGQLQNNQEEQTLAQTKFQELSSSMTQEINDHKHKINQQRESISSYIISLEEKSATENYLIAQMESLSQSIQIQNDNLIQSSKQRQTNLEDYQAKELIYQQEKQMSEETIFQKQQLIDQYQSQISAQVENIFQGKCNEQGLKLSIDQIISSNNQSTQQTQQQIIILNDDIKQITREKEQMKMDKEQSVAEVGQWRTQLREQLSQFDLQSDRADDLQTKCNELEDTIKDLRFQFDQGEIELQNQVILNKKQTNDLQLIITQQQENILNLDQRVAILQNQQQDTIQTEQKQIQQQEIINSQLIIQMEDQISNYQAHIKSLENDLIDKTQDMLDIDDRFNVFEEQAQEKQEIIKNMNQELSNANQEIEKMNQFINQKDSVSLQLNKSISDAGEIEKELNTKIQDLKDQWDEQLISLNQNEQNLIIIMSEQMNRIQFLQEQLKSEEQVVQEIKQQQISQLNKLNQSYQEEIDKLQDQLKGQAQTLQQSADMQKQIDCELHQEQAQKITDLLNNLEEIKKLQEQTVQMNYHQQNQIEDYQLLDLDQKNTIQKLQDDIIKQQIETKELRILNGSIQRDLELADQQTENIQLNLQVQKGNFEIVISERNELKLKLAETSQQEQQCKIQDQALRELQYQFDTIQSEIFDQEQVISERNQKIEKLQQLIQSHKSITQDYESQIKFIKDKLKVQEGVLKEQEANFDTSRLQMMQVTLDKQQLLSENAQLSLFVENLEEQLSQLNQNLSEQTSEKDNLILSMDKKMVDKEKEKIQQILALTDEKQKLQSQVKDLLIQSEQKQQEAFNKLNAQISENKSLKSHITNLNHEIEAIQNNLQDQQLAAEDHQEMMDQVAQLNQYIVQLEETLNDKEAEESKSQVMIQQSNRELKNLLEENQRITMQTQKQGGQILNLQELIQNLELQAGKQSDELQTAQQNQHASNSQIKDLKTQLKGLQQQIIGLNDQLRNSQSKINQGFMNDISLDQIASPHKNDGGEFRDLINEPVAMRRPNASAERGQKRPYQDLSLSRGKYLINNLTKNTSSKSQALDQLYMECLERSKSILERNMDLVTKTYEVGTVTTLNVQNQSPKKSDEQASFVVDKSLNKSFQASQGLNSKVSAKVPSGKPISRERVSAPKTQYDQQPQKNHHRQNSLNSHQGTKVQYEHNPQMRHINLQSQLAQQQTKQGISKIQSNYKGDLLNGMRHGRGRYIYDNEDSYEGEWYKDQRYGYGTLKDNNSDIYLGYWQFDQMNGCGHLRNVQVESTSTPIDYHNLDEIGNMWVSYQGEFSNGQFHGYGTLTLSNGERFHGSFLNGKAQGTGTFYRHNGEIIPGQWKNNVHVDKNYGRK